MLDLNQCLVLVLWLLAALAFGKIEKLPITEEYTDEDYPDLPHSHHKHSTWDL